MALGVARPRCKGATEWPQLCTESTPQRRHPRYLRLFEICVASQGVYMVADQPLDISQHCLQGRTAGRVPLNSMEAAAE